MEELNLNVSKGTEELVVRKGEAAKLYDPIALDINGTIDAVARFIENRKSTDAFTDGISYKDCHIIVDKEVGSIILKINENNHFADVIKGFISVHPHIEAFGINSGAYISPEEMANFLKMRKHLFKSQSDFAEIFSNLKRFEAKVNQDVKSSNDDRGSYEIKRAQAVEHNIPNTFDLEVALFKGAEKVTIPVEFLVDRSLHVCLSSTDLIQMLDEEREKIIDAQVADIQRLAEEIVVIYA